MTLRVHGEGPLASALAELECDVPALVTVAAPPRLQAVAELDPEAWRARFRELVEEPFFAAQSFLREGGERWIAVTTPLATQPFRGGGADGTCAAALHTLVRVAAVENAERGVCANVVVPGFLEETLPPELDEELARADTPTRRLTTVADVAAVVAFLLSPAAAQVNGEVLRVDGGYTITKGSMPSAYREPPSSLTK